MDRTKILEETRNQKKDAYDKYCEECTKTKELRELQTKALREHVANIIATKETQITEANEEGEKDAELLEKNHEETVKKLKDEIAKLEKNLDRILKQNEATENQLRKDYKNKHTSY